MHKDSSVTTTSGRSPASVIGSAIQSKASQTHAFRKLKTPSRCKECDSYLYFQGLECHEVNIDQLPLFMSNVFEYNIFLVQCGISVHKKCLSTLPIVCPHKRLPKKSTTFGVPLVSQVPSSVDDAIPAIVAKCVAEIDSRGRKIRGLYRVSGVKSKVEKLCQSFETGAGLVDLSDVHPNVIANVLKLYFRQLPEPLLTHRLYPEFIRVAKEFPASTSNRMDDQSVNTGSTESNLSLLTNVELQEIHQLVAVVSKLPKVHYLTLSFLMHHLKKVADKSSENNMPSSNLGIVFGPTLLRTSEGTSSLSSLVDTVHQTRVVDLLITYAHQVFGSPLKVDQTGKVVGFADPEEDSSEEGEEERCLSDDSEDDLRGGQLVRRTSRKCTKTKYLDDILLESPLSPPPVFSSTIVHPRLSRHHYHQHHHSHGNLGKSDVMSVLSKSVSQIPGTSGDQQSEINQEFEEGENEFQGERNSSINQGDNIQSDNKNGHDRSIDRYFSSSAVITLAGQKIVTSSPSSISDHTSNIASSSQSGKDQSKSLISHPTPTLVASSTSDPRNSLEQDKNLIMTTVPDNDDQEWKSLPQISRSQYSRSSLNELRKQFFTLPTPVPTMPVNYRERLHGQQDIKDKNRDDQLMTTSQMRKDSTDDGGSSEGEMLSTAATHAKLKRAASGHDGHFRTFHHSYTSPPPVPPHTGGSYLTIRSSTRASSSSCDPSPEMSPRMRFLEKEMLSRSSTSTNPFSPTPEMSRNLSNRPPKFV